MTVIEAEEKNEEIPRQLELFDLLCIGIGTTVGTGIFATAGQIINETAGPGAALSWIVAGLACVLSGVAYMEMSSLIPSSGSCYAYAYHTLGELPAFIAASFLTLEYAVSGAGVARTWASKVQEWAEYVDVGRDYGWLNTQHTNVMGILIQLMCMFILLAGLDVGKKVINTVTVIKVSLVFFMIIAGFAGMDVDNLSPFIPPMESTTGKYGYQGVMIGASKCFFGYVGFDEVCCMAAETKNARKIMPMAVLGVVLGTCFLSTLASLSLAGLQPYMFITSGFGGAFLANGWVWASWIVQVGELLTLPLVVLVCLLAQPRLHYGLAVDGLMPKFFANIDARGNLFWNTLVTGLFFSLVSFVVPFQYIWHLVDFGVLTSFNMTNTALVVTRGGKSTGRVTGCMVGYLGTSLAAVLLLQKRCIEGDHGTCSWSIVTTMTLLACASLCCFAHVVFLLHAAPTMDTGRSYRAPFVPFTPCLSILVNWYLLVQMDNLSMVYGLIWIIAGVCLYFSYGFWNSVGQQTGWQNTLDKANNYGHDGENEELGIPATFFKNIIQS